MKIFKAQGTNHPILYTDVFFTSKPHWIHSQPVDLKNGDILKCDFKFQHVETWVPCEVCQTNNGLIVKLENSKRAITSGQFAVFAKDNECLGSAQIIDTGGSSFSYSYLKYFKVKNKIGSTKISVKV